MITKFKLFENQSYYLINIDQFWQTYRENFHLLYPNKKVDHYQMLSLFRKDIVVALIGKIAEINVDDRTLSGRIDDVWVRFDTHRKLDPNWEFKVKIDNSKWLILGNLSIKIFSSKTEFENNIFKFLNFKKFDL